MVTNEIEISDLLGKPYQRGGRGPGSFDCFGLGLEIDKRRGVYIPDYETPRDKKARTLLFEFVKDSSFSRLEKPIPWCWVAFRIIENGRIKWHCGKVLPDCRRFIHIRVKANVCINRLNDLYYKEWLEGFYKSNYD